MTGMCKLVTGLVILLVLELSVISFYWNYNTQNSDTRKIQLIQSWQDFCSTCMNDRATPWKLHKSFMEHTFTTDKEEKQNVSYHAFIKLRNSSLMDDFNLKGSNCSWLQEHMNNNFYNSETEKRFPLAFTLVVHNSPEQILRLIQILYRKQNSFCIHCDAKSPFTKLFEGISNCFDNIVVPTNLTKVVWGHSSILEAQLKCMRELATLRTKQEHKWQYLINLCGKELPLVTNREMVQTLRKLSGTSNINARIVLANETEFINRFTYPVSLDKDKKRVYYDNTRRLNSSVLLNSSHYYKSSGYHALSFPFAHHLLYNTTATSTLKFFLQSKSPEEHYYATVFMTHGVPGGYTSLKQKLYFKVINSFWVPLRKCSEKVVHRVCIVGAGDLMRVRRNSHGHFFHNKYFMEYDDSVMRFMEKRLVEKNLKEFTFDCKRKCNIMISC